MKENVIIIILLLTSGLVFSQQGEKLIDMDEIDAQIDEAYLIGNQGEIKEAQDKLFKLKEEAEIIDYDKGVLAALNGIINIYYQQGDLEKGISYSSEAEVLARKLNDDRILSNLLRMKGLAHKDMGLIDLSKKELKQAYKVLDKTTDNNGKYYVKALIYDNLAGIADIESKEDSMIYYSLRAIKEIEKISDDDSQYYVSKHSYLAFAYMNLGLASSNAGEFEEAEEHFAKSMAVYEANPKLFSSEEIILYSIMSNHYYKKKEYDKAILYGNKGLEIEKATASPHYRRDIYKTLSSVYLAQEETDKAREFTILYNELKDSIDRANKSTVNKAVTQKIDENRAEYEESRRKSLVKFLLFGCILAVSFFTFWQFHVRRVRRKYEEIIIRLKNESKAETAKTVPILISDSQENELEELGMTEETLEELLQRLEEFENLKMFSKPEVSFPYLVNYLGTNTKYLSYILKYQKGKSFNNYINDLRVDYLIRLLYKDSKRLDYKLDYLSEEVGFQSRTTFINSFKKRTGLTPSYFIKQLQKEVESEKTI